MTDTLQWWIGSSQVRFLSGTEFSKEVQDEIAAELFCEEMKGFIRPNLEDSCKVLYIIIDRLLAVDFNIIICIFLKLNLNWNFLL